METYDVLKFRKKSLCNLIQAIIMIRIKTVTVIKKSSWVLCLPALIIILKKIQKEVSFIQIGTIVLAKPISRLRLENKRFLNYLIIMESTHLLVMMQCEESRQKQMTQTNWWRILWALNMAFCHLKLGLIFILQNMISRIQM
jgi:hypothetical protein